MAVRHISYPFVCSENPIMGRIAPGILVIACISAGCVGPPQASVLKPESARIRTGMQPEEVQAICGKPDLNISDPLSGAAMWQYKDEEADDRLTVMFNMDGVAKVIYRRS
jgi:hypothetical protein